MNTTLEEIQEWYESQCDGDWEHSYGVKIETLDNPGWSVTIDLTGTELEDKNFTQLSFEKSENDWVCCWVEGQEFLGDGGTKNLEEILKIFLKWAES